MLSRSQTHAVEWPVRPNDIASVRQWVLAREANAKMASGLSIFGLTES
jgi:hypothetical protein